MFKLTPILRGYEDIKELLIQVLPMGAMLAGGYVRYMCSPSSDVPLPSDIDIFCRSEQEFLNINMAILMSGSWYEAGENDWAVRYFHIEPRLAVKPTLQLIRPGFRKAKSVADLLDQFDFTVVQAGLDGDTPDGMAWVSPLFEQDELWKNIRLVRTDDNPIQIMRRVLKYVRKGYHLDTGALFKIFDLWDQAPEEFHERLQFLARTPELISDDRHEFYDFLKAF